MRPALLSLALAAGLAACQTPPPAPPLPTAAVRLWIFGEQHDQPDQQRQVAQVVGQLAAQQRLAAVVLEMADAGRHTRGLGPNADEASVRQALGWTGWPWEPYAPVVMNAVRAGVPVLGGNLPRAATRPTMDDTSREALVDATVRERVLDAVRQGHCGHLPATREPGMLRVQVARDHTLARSAAEAVAGAAPHQVVLLLTGVQHASRDRGVPWHLQRQGWLAASAVQVTAFGPAAAEAGLAVDQAWPARQVQRPDPCAGLAEKLATPPAPATR